VASSGYEGAAYELAHVAILTGWPRLGGWLDEEQATREVAVRLAQGKVEWERTGRADEALLGAQQLAGLEAFVAVGLPPDVEAFVVASREAVRRVRRRRIALAGGLPLAAALIAGGVVVGRAWKERRETAALVAAHLTEARAAQVEAQDLDAQNEAARREAFALYDANDWAGGEARWPDAITLAARANSRYGAAVAAASLALAADPRNAAARALEADVTYSWLLGAERDHDKLLLAELTARLALVDDDGSRRARLAVPAHLRVTTSPPGATIVVHSVRTNDRGVRVEDEGRTVTAEAPLELTPGSYVVTTSAPGRFATRMPIYLTRGQDARVDVPLPAVADVPAGFVYIPTGETFFGAPDGEPVRHVYGAQPEHRIRVGAFLIAERETTYAEYLEFLTSLSATERDARRPHVGTHSTSDLEMTFGGDGSPALTLRGVTVRRGGPLCRPKRTERRCQDWLQMPAAGISLEDAVAYTAWFARVRVPGARLCAEREWERAARGADDRMYPWGDEARPGDANFQETYEVDSERMGEDAVGSFPIDRSPLGVADLGGNVAEWVGDIIDRSRATTRIARGGYWSDVSLYALAAMRPVYDEERNEGVGVRVCAMPRTQ
jgi:formylglycine-generating enzyme required for sulfatase activity